MSVDDGEDIMFGECSVWGSMLLDRDDKMHNQTWPPVVVVESYSRA